MEEGSCSLDASQPLRDANSKSVSNLHDLPDGLSLIVLAAGDADNQPGQHIDDCLRTILVPAHARTNLCVRSEKSAVSRLYTDLSYGKPSLRCASTLLRNL